MDQIAEDKNYIKITVLSDKGTFRTSGTLDRHTTRFRGLKSHINLMNTHVNGGVAYFITKLLDTFFLNWKKGSWRLPTLLCTAPF
jgi:hypothetical protein